MTPRTGQDRQESLDRQELTLPPIPALLPSASPALADGGYSPPHVARPLGSPPSTAPTAPNPTSGPGAPPTTPGSGGPRARGAVTSDGGWRTWWEANADALRPPHPERLTPEGGLFRPGDADAIRLHAARAQE